GADYGYGGGWQSSQEYWGTRGAGKAKGKGQPKWGRQPKAPRAAQFPAFDAMVTDDKNKDIPTATYKIITLDLGG
ncbi:unnamed protein product, partial [Symbiodinium microadriaticum]